MISKKKQENWLEFVKTRIKKKYYKNIVGVSSCGFNPKKKKEVY